MYEVLKKFLLDNNKELFYFTEFKVLLLLELIKEVNKNK